MLPEVVYAEQLALLLKLMNLTSLTLEPEDGADAGMVLAPLPAELLDLPHLMVRLECLAAAAGELLRESNVGSASSMQYHAPMHL